MGPGAVVKAACFGSRRSRVRVPRWPSSFKETKCGVPGLRLSGLKFLILCLEGSVILFWFSWPSLAYTCMCTKVALTLCIHSEIDVMAKTSARCIFRI